VRATVKAGVELIRQMLPVLNARRREPRPISELVSGSLRRVGRVLGHHSQPGLASPPTG